MNTATKSYSTDHLVVNQSDFDLGHHIQAPSEDCHGNDLVMAVLWTGAFKLGTYEVEEVDISEGEEEVRRAGTLGAGLPECVEVGHGFDMVEDSDNEDGRSDRSDDGEGAGAKQIPAPEHRRCPLVQYFDRPDLAISPDFGMHHVSGIIEAILSILMGTMSDKHGLGRNYDIQTNKRVFNEVHISTALSKLGASFEGLCLELSVDPDELVYYVSRASLSDVTEGKAVLKESFLQLGYECSYSFYMLHVFTSKQLLASSSKVVGNALSKLLELRKDESGKPYTPKLKSAISRLLAGPIGMMMFDSMSDLSPECRRAYILVCLGLNLILQRSFNRAQMSAAIMALITSLCFLECYLDVGMLNGVVHAMVHSVLRIFGCGPLGECNA